MVVKIWSSKNTRSYHYKCGNTNLWLSYPTHAHTDTQRAPVNPLPSIRGSEPRGWHSKTSVQISTSAPSSPASIPLQLKPFYLWFLHWALWQLLEQGLSSTVSPVTAIYLVSVVLPRMSKRRKWQAEWQGVWQGGGALTCRVMIKDVKCRVVSQSKRLFDLELHLHFTLSTFSWRFYFAEWHAKSKAEKWASAADSTCAISGVGNLSPRGPVSCRF